MTKIKEKYSKSQNRNKMIKKYQVEQTFTVKNETLNCTIKMKRAYRHNLRETQIHKMIGKRLKLEIFFSLIFV